jgi:hypothetical protein
MVPIQRIEDCFGDVVHIGQDLVIPEAYDSKTNFLQEGYPLSI